MAKQDAARERYSAAKERLMEHQDTDKEREEEYLEKILHADTPEEVELLKKYHERHEKNAQHSKLKQQKSMKFFKGVYNFFDRMPTPRPALYRRRRARR